MAARRQVMSPLCQAVLNVKSLLDRGAYNMAAHVEQNQQTESKEAASRWWKLPFDATTNFSLFGYLWGGFGWASNDKKKVDLTLDDR